MPLGDIFLSWSVWKVSVIIKRPIPTPLFTRKWRLEQAEEIAARDAESEAKRAEWKSEAARELDSWHSKQNEVRYSDGIL